MTYKYTDRYIFEIAITMKKSEKTRQDIITKTAPIFNMKGFAGTSLSDITLATGLSKGSIYGNFGNKDEVALAVFEYNWKILDGQFQAVMASQKTVKGKLLAYLTVYKKLMSGEVSPGGCPVLNTAIDSDDTHPILRESALMVLLTWKQTIIDLTKAGIANDEIKPTTNAEQTALTILALIEGGIMISRLTNISKMAELLTDSLRTYIDQL